MPEFNDDAVKRIQNVVRDYETQFYGGVRGPTPHVPNGTVKPFVLSEDLLTGDSATATLRLPDTDPASFVNGEENIPIYAGDMPSAKKIVSGTAIWAVKYGEWYVISAWACMEDTGV